MKQTPIRLAMNELTLKNHMESASDDEENRIGNERELRSWSEVERERKREGE